MINVLYEYQKRFVSICLICLMCMGVYACGQKQDTMAKIKDLDCTVMAEDNIPEELLEKIDVSRLRGQDPAFVRRVVLIILSMLGGALMDSFLCPERSGEYRRELQAQLELIKYGSLQEQPRS